MKQKPDLFDFYAHPVKVVHVLYEDWKTYGNMPLFLRAAEKLVRMKRFFISFISYYHFENYFFS